MMTSMKDKFALEMLKHNLELTKDRFICTLCGKTTNGWVSECPKCHYKAN